MFNIRCSITSNVKGFSPFSPNVWIYIMQHREKYFNAIMCLSCQAQEENAVGIGSCAAIVVQKIRCIALAKLRNTARRQLAWKRSCSAQSVRSSLFYRCLKRSLLMCWWVVPANRSQRPPWWCPWQNWQTKSWFTWLVGPKKFLVRISVLFFVYFSQCFYRQCVILYPEIRAQYSKCAAWKSYTFYSTK